MMQRMVGKWRLMALVLTLWALVPVVAEADEPQRKLTRSEYIELYAPLAVEQQTLYGIPASITLAQGILESANGNSRLATEANNHFGIKCGSTWEGPSIRHDDDALQECFRAYASPEESYIDHSLFLSERKWYRPLFDLDPKDYKAWAHGLKKAGYATNPKYAELLIKIIEDNELYRYDNALLADFVSPTPEPTEPAVEPEQKAEAPAEQEAEAPTPRKVNIDTYGIATCKVGHYGIYATAEGRRYVVAAEGDNLRRIARTVGLSERTLRKLNTLERGEPISVGQRIFIER